MTNKKRSVGILGAGISGLSAAYKLSKNNIAITVYEKDDQVGGAIKTHNENGWLVEEGPNTLMVKHQQVWDFLKELDLINKSIEAGKTAKKRFIVKDGQPTPLPMSPSNFLTTNLFSAKAKFRLLKEPFIPQSNKADESIADFITRRLGREPLDYAVNPFVSGIYAGDPKKLSVKHTFEPLWDMEQQHGSLLKGMFKRDRNSNPPKRALLSFEKGNQQLPMTIANALGNTVQTETKIQSVLKSGERWTVEGQQKNGTFTDEHDIILSTLPAHSLSAIFEDTIFAPLNDLPYAPLCVVALGFSDNQIGHPLDGFGMLIPEVENCKTLGALFSSSLFPGRAPKNHQLLTCFIGGARNPELAEKSENELRTIVLDEISKLLNITGEPTYSHFRFWPKTIPQYEVGYDKVLNQIAEIENQKNGLFIVGNFRGGVSVPDCILSGFETAKKVQTFLKGR
ncbi:protoporphyrinogen oxidase [Aliifodinibius salipaludis]|uniref:Coproporphyrinogen III oxidase n=1 Tax=Fodinibius salipaludis TaxID=2032627 RepID=A0A2A2G9U3_9BACT|nr:protoporphyrinogen oxidase [Aliifodinibius salipaludis]PAU94516.1 protoporphyrinogen oxidase [Aliifodinibius salipaludis]